MRSIAPPLIIAGGGLAGCLAALALAQRRPDISILLVEHGETFGGSHVWSFFDSDIDEEDRWLIEPLVGSRWQDHEVRFPARQRVLGIGYNSVHSADLDREVRRILMPEQYRLGGRVEAISERVVVLDSGEEIGASAVLDARGPDSFSGLELGWQKFVGRTYQFDRPHGVKRPIIMDATVAQDDGYRFVYSLPFSPTELMVEDTYYSNSPTLDPPLVRGRLDQIVSSAFNTTRKCVVEETGVLPVLLDGDVETLWPSSEPPVARLGLRGGFFHPTTGYSLPDAVRNAILLTRQDDLSGPALHRLFHERARVLWKERRFFQRLNRMLFHAASPKLRYRVLEHFYRLPEAVVARFYAARLTGMDKLRILSGRPPVPVRDAIAAMRRRAA